MLTKFKVKNFKNFKDWFSFDLISHKNYEFNSECVNNNIISKSLIYGPNGCGKSNLGHAIFDIKTHLTDEKINLDIYSNYLNAESNSEVAEFAFTFQFEDNIIEYKYGKKNVSELVYETLIINNNEVISLDRSKANQAMVNLKGAETLNLNLEKKDLSIVKYVENNTILEENRENSIFRKFFLFITPMVTLSTALNYNANNFIQSDLFSFKDFELFLNNVNIKCKLTMQEVDGKERLAFDYGNKKLDFLKTASTGTRSLLDLYNSLVFLKLITFQSLNTEDEFKDEVRKITKTGIEIMKEETVVDIKKTTVLPFIYIDEYDAFYHHALSKEMIQKLKNINCQVILTTHNTSIMSNDLLRPDCYFIMDNEKIKPMHTFTKKELRKAHNIEKMYKAGAFNE